MVQASLSVRDMQDAGQALERLAINAFVVEDGTWLERFGRRLLGLQGQSAAAEAAQEAVRDDEVILPVAVLETLWTSRAIPRAALAAALREVWLDFGLQLNCDDPEGLTAIFRDTRGYEEFLMASDELQELSALPKTFVAYRGQVYSDGPNATATGASWTLAEEVADWYAAPVPMLGQPHGWVLRAEVPKDAVLALFLERGEREIVLDMAMVANLPVHARRGTCDTFPQHLSCPRSR